MRLVSGLVFALLSLNSTACERGSRDVNTCDEGDTRVCYTGVMSTLGVGACRAGSQVCDSNNVWGACIGQTTPGTEVCGNGVDEDCNGTVDDVRDDDGDGFTTCDGDCCDSTTACGTPSLVNPGAFDVAGNNLDDDCDGTADNGTAACDASLASNSADALDYVRAIDLCQTTTTDSRRWGVLHADLTTTDDSVLVEAHPNSHSIRAGYGTNVRPKMGNEFILLSTGTAADPSQSNPALTEQLLSTSNDIQAEYPRDWWLANGEELPSAPGCESSSDDLDAFDPVMLSVWVRVPTNARSFKVHANFYSAEYPGWVCSSFNDFFVVLLDSTWNGEPANPSDHNLAFYQAPNGNKYPVGVNLASGNTGLFTQCINGTVGCQASDPSTYSSCTSTDDLAGTGYDAPFDPEFHPCGASGAQYGATGWLQISGNVVGGEEIQLRFAIWDTGDPNLDSLVVLDGFEWQVEASDPGTILF